MNNGHGRSSMKLDEYQSNTLTERELLVVKIESIKSTIAGSYLPAMSSFQTQQKLALIDAEKDLADYDALNAVNDAQAIEQGIDAWLDTGIVKYPHSFNKVTELPIGERVAQAYGQSDFRTDAELDGTGNDPDLVTELRGGF